MSCRSRAGVCLAGVRLLFLMCPILLGCGAASWLRHKVDCQAPGAGAHPGPGPQGFESLLPEAAALGWAPSGRIEVARDVQSMTSFVDGAAEILWEKGVRRMAVQSYGGPGAGDSADAFRYEFAGRDLALDFWKENCPGPAPDPGSDGTRSLSCERSDPSLSQAFFWTDRLVLEVRLYGDAADREALLRLLDSVFQDPAGVAGGQGGFSP